MTQHRRALLAAVATLLAVATLPRPAASVLLLGLALYGAISFADDLYGHLQHRRSRRPR